MANFLFVNNVETTLAQPVSNSATVIQLSSMTNAPTSIPSGYVWEVTLNDEATEKNFEILYATAYLGNGQYQVLRGQEGTTPLSFLAGDYAFGAVTAGMLGQFIQTGSLDGFVQLSPAAAQNGFINVAGNITGGGTLFGNNVQATNGISGKSGAFATTLSAGSQLSVNLPYSNRAISGLAMQLVGSANTVGIGPSSGLSAQGITGSTLAIAQLGSAKVFAFDANGNLGIMGGLYSASVSASGLVSGASGTFSSQLSAPSILQNGLQVLSLLTSTDNSVALARSGSTFNLSVASSPAILKWYNQNGVQQPNPKIVSGSTFCAGGTTPVTLQGAAIFTSAATYVVITAAAYGAPSFTAPAYPENISGSEFLLYQGNPSTCNWVAIGY